MPAGFIQTPQPPFRGQGLLRGRLPWQLQSEPQNSSTFHTSPAVVHHVTSDESRCTNPGSALQSAWEHAGTVFLMMFEWIMFKACVTAPINEMYHTDIQTSKQITMPPLSSYFSFWPQLYQSAAQVRLLTEVKQGFNWSSTWMWDQPGCCWKWCCFSEASRRCLLCGPCWSWHPSIVKRKKHIFDHRKLLEREKNAWKYEQNKDCFAVYATSLCWLHSTFSQWEVAFTHMEYAAL